MADSVVTFLPIQAEGTPSRENPIPVYPRLYIDGIGAIWGGSINADKGILYSEWKQIDLGTVNWDKRKRYEDTITLFITKSISDKGPANIHIYCPIYPYNYIYSIDYMLDKTINDSYQVRSKCIEISDTVYDDYTAAEFKAAISGVTCVYKLATPIEYTLTAPQLQQAIQQLGLQMPSALEMKRRVMMASAESVWGGYHPVEYLEGIPGQQFILTGVLANVEGTVIELDFMLSRPTGSHVNYVGIFGNYLSESDSAFRMILATNDNTYYANENQTAGYSTRIVAGINARHTLKMGGKKYKLDDTESDMRDVAYNYSNSTQIALYKSGSSNAIVYDFDNYRLRIYGCKFFVGDTLTHHFKPCIYRGVPGLFDVITKKFHGNMGVGQFTTPT